MARTARTTAAKPASSRSASSKRAAAPPAPSPARRAAPTKEELKAEVKTLRAQIEKLESANKRLRAKQREAGKAAKETAARIAALEAELASRPRAQPRRRRPRAIDPGDAVPEGVAVLEPQPLDEEAETALENLEERMRSP